QAATQGARELLNEGKTGEARLALLAVLTPVQGFLPVANQPPIKQLLSDYMEVRNGAWPHVPAELTPAALNGFLSAFDAQRTELLRLARLFDPEPQHYPNGIKAYYRHVEEILSQRAHAYELAGKLAMQAPPPDQLIVNQQVFMTLFKKDIPKTFYMITFGPVVAGMHAQKRVIPENLTLAGKALEKAAGQNSASAAREALNSAKNALDLVEAIEIALRDDLDLSNILTNLSALKNEYKKQNQRALALYEKEIDSNRMPAAKTWRSGKAGEKAVLTEARSVFTSLFPDETILAQNLQSPEFTERWDSWWEKDILYTAYHGYVLVATASRNGSGKCLVRVQRYRRDLKADGSWSALMPDDTFYSYPVREKNI
ncbi:hypothetical protein, partial [Desulfomarina sp.]